MASQRIGPKVDTNTETKLINADGKDMDEDNSKIKITKDKTILVIFVGLLVDLLGMKIHKIRFYSTVILSSLHPDTASLPCPYISLQGE